MPTSSRSLIAGVLGPFPSGVTMRRSMLASRRASIYRPPLRFGRPSSSPKLSAKISLYDVRPAQDFIHVPVSEEGSAVQDEYAV